MIDHDIHHRAYLIDLLPQQDYLTAQAKQLRALLNDTENQLAQNIELVAYMQSIIRKGDIHEVPPTE